MKIFSYKNPFKEKILLLEKDNREKIKKTFKVNQYIADFAHNINENLSIWIIDKLFEQLIQERHFTRDQVINFLNSDDSDKKNYLDVFQNKIFSVLDYYANPEGKAEYPTFDDFKKERFDVLYNKSDVWHKGLKSIAKKTTEIIDTEEGIRILKKYEPDSNGTIYYWADLNKRYSQIESGRMGHCGNTNKGTTLLSLRSFTPSLNNSYVSKSHITISVNRVKKYYTQCKGKQNRKPAIQYTSYIFDLFLFDNDIQGYESEYASGSDFTPLDLSISQINQLKKVKPKLVNQFLSASTKEVENDAISLTPEELVDKYFTKGFILDKNNYNKFRISTGYLPIKNAMSFIMNAILPVIIKDSSLFEKVVSYITTKESPTDLLITESIIEYCIFTNNFSKIKNHINKLFEETQNLNFNTYQEINNIYNRNICFFTNFAELYPDYFTSYAYKKIEPLIDNLLTSKNSIKDVQEIFDKNTKNVIISYMNKYKDTERMKDIYYIIIFENLYNYAMTEVERWNNDNNYIVLEECDSSGIEQLVFKIEETNKILKDSANYDTYQEMIRDTLFGNPNFISFTVLGLYVKNPELLNYSIYDDYDPEFLNRTFDDVKVNIEDLGVFKFKHYRGTKINSFASDLENVFSEYWYDTTDDDVENFLNTVSDRSQTSSKPIYKKTLTEIEERILSLTKKSLTELTEEYIKENNAENKRYRLYDVYEYIKENYDIEELNDDVTGGISDAYTISYQDELYRRMKSEVIEFFENTLQLNINKNKIYLHQDEVYVSTNMQQIVNFYVDNIMAVFNYTNFNFEYTPERLIESYIGGMIEYNNYSVSIDSDINNYPSDEEICEAFLNR